ncbi:MAG: hypothetical protein KKB50_14790 [Planctomycetes bacterium]|nr:hypothetical protein [Planctomycetota bacterium]
MSTWTLPQALFNPLTAPAPLGPAELLAGPLGLVAFILLVPLVRLVARTHRRSALVLAGLVWLFATLGWHATVVLVAGIVAASAWVAMLGALRRAARLSSGVMIALVWGGLHLLLLPLWWFPHGLAYGWAAARPSALHALGFSYFLLRLVAWGVDLARNPTDLLRPADTLCWLLYPPCMRNGPLLLRQQFLDRLDAWEPRQAPARRLAAKRLGSAWLGLAGLAIAAVNTPRVLAGAPDFFTAPQDYTTSELVRAFYLIPIQAYLFLWAYNEIAAGLATWIGIRVDDNFKWLPRATSVRDFWRRWHVTVGAWLRNYVYIPLGGNRGHVVPLRYLAVFGYCALWHGSSWSFLAWGLSQALALTVQRGWDRLRERLGWQGRPAGRAWTVLCWLVTMHYQIATIVVFADFEHLGLRLFPELARRLLGG